MIISKDTAENLKASWGEKADCLSATAEVRVYDPHSCWECFIFAMNPEDEDEIACILHGYKVEVCHWRLSRLLTMYNDKGDPPIIDEEFRPRASETIVRLLKVMYDR